MPQTQVQILRSSISGARPAAGSQAPGVLYTNFADKQLGVILPDGTALDLIPTASSLLSTDAGNASALGSDGLIYTPTVIGGAATVSDIPPADPVQGMFWFNTTDGFLYIYYDDGSSAQWVSIASNGGGGGSAGGAGLHMGDAPPADPAAFPLWWNSANGFLYVFYNDGDSSQWVSVTGNGGASSGGSSTGAGLHMGDAPPADPAAYPFWWNSTDGLLYVYYDDGNSAQWVSTSSSGGGSSGASSGLFFGENPPINTLEYSFWYNTANGQLHVWYEDTDSSQWVSVTGSGGGSGGGSSLVSSVNGKIGEVVLTYTDVDAASSYHDHDGRYSQLGHTHAIADVTGLQSALDSKAAATHNHDAAYVNVTGDTMTGALVLAGNPTAAMQAATKEFAEQRVPLAGDSITRLRGGDGTQRDFRYGEIITNGSGDATIFFTPPFAYTPRVFLSPQGGGLDNFCLMARVTSATAEYANIRTNVWDGGGASAATGSAMYCYYFIIGTPV
jgi:hypothetical protein